MDKLPGKISCYNDSWSLLLGTSLTWI